MTDRVRRLALLALTAAIAVAFGAAAGAAAPLAAVAQPTTTAAFTPAATPSGWTLGAVAVELAAFTDGPALLGTAYRPFGTGTWLPYWGPFLVSVQGISTYEYVSWDDAPSEEAVRTFTLRIDSSPPVSFAPLGIPKGWSRKPVTVRLRAADALSGVARIEWRPVGAASWIPYAAPFAIAAQGVTTIEYRAVDNVGLEETPQKRTISIDATPPATKAFAATVKRGKKVKLVYRVNDVPAAAGARALATVQIFSGARNVKTFRPATVVTNVRTSLAWRCKLEPGTYSIRVLAEDAAGNTQSKAGGAKLTVKQ